MASPEMSLDVRGKAWRTASALPSRSRRLVSLHELLQLETLALPFANCDLSLWWTSRRNTL